MTINSKISLLGLKREELSNLESLKWFPEKFSKIARVTAFSVLLAITWCWQGSNEHNFASEHDIESSLSNSLKDYSSNKPWFSPNSVSKLELSKMETLSKEIWLRLASIKDLDKKAIFIDIDGVNGIVTNEFLKKIWYNTTLNYYLNWSDDLKWLDVVNYDRLFSVVSQYTLTKEDNHQIKKEDFWYTTKPWTVILDYNRLPDDWSDLESRDSNNTFFNMYWLTDNDLPNRDIFKWEEKVRDWAVLVTYSTWINYDINEYLRKLTDEWVNVQVIFIRDWHVEWVSWQELKDYETKIAWLDENLSNQTNSSWWTHPVFVYPYWLYWTTYHNRVDSIWSSYAPLWSSFSSNNSTRWNSVFTSLNTSGSRLSSVISSSRISWARGWAW